MPSRSIENTVAIDASWTRPVHGVSPRSYILYQRGDTMARFFPDGPPRRRREAGCRVSRLRRFDSAAVPQGQGRLVHSAHPAVQLIDQGILAVDGLLGGGGGGVNDELCQRVGFEGEGLRA